MLKRITKLSSLIIVLAIIVSGCTFPWQKKVSNNIPVETDKKNSQDVVADITPVSTKQLKKFSDYKGLEKFLEENYTKKASIGEIIIDTADKTRDAGDSSSINIQITGIDEADIIKSDGKNIYALVRNELKIIKASPVSDAEVIGSITFESRPQDIFISGDNLAVFGSSSQTNSLDSYQKTNRNNPYTFLKVFNLTNPANPTLVRELDFEGYYKDARLIGNYVYLFTESSGDYIKGESLTPQVISKGVVLSNDCAANKECFSPEVFYFDISYNSFNFFNIAAININDNMEAISGQSYLMDYGQNVYVSQKNVYITYTETINEDDLEQAVKRELIFAELSVEEQSKIKEIETAADYILSATEKKVKVDSIINNYLSGLGGEEEKTAQSKINEGMRQKLMEKSSDTEKTAIYKIALNGRNFEYRGFGEVNGQVLNQLSMNEEGDYFRIATTRGSVWSRLTDAQSESYSNVFVLDNGLKVVGSLENLATNEKIYTARFLGNRAYLITVKQTDPLYIIGLSDPAKPAVLGAVKVPGSSTYFYPADKNGNKLFGVGHNMEDDGSGNIKSKGLKISLFDFADLAKPKELNSFIIGDNGSDSIALGDHKAFLYSEGKNLLSLPAVLRDNNKTVFSGSLIFNIVDDKFVLREKIDHTFAAAKLDSWNGYDYYDDTVKRSFYINDNLFTFSNKFLKINSLNDLSSVKNLTLTKDEDDYIIIPAPDDTPGIIPENNGEIISEAPNTNISSSTSSEIIPGNTEVSTSTNPI